MNCNAPAPAAQTNISNFPFNEREIKNFQDLGPREDKDFLVKY